MRVEVIDTTVSPERTVCLAARGDYYEGFVGEDDYPDVMADVEPDESDYEWAEAFLRDRHTSPGDDSPSVVPFEDVYDDFDEYLDQVSETWAKRHALLDDLCRKRHFGPWEHASLTIGVKGISRACMAQLTRHRHSTFDVQSMRYVDFSDLAADAVVPETIRSSGETISREAGLVDLDDEVRADARERYQELVDAAGDVYDDLVELGVPQEDARMALPIGTPVNLTVTMNARSMMHVFDLRATGAAQWEIRQLTERLRQVFDDEFPITSACYERHGPFANAP